MVQTAVNIQDFIKIESTILAASFDCCNTPNWIHNRQTTQLQALFIYFAKFNLLAKVGKERQLHPKVFRSRRALGILIKLSL